MRAGVRGRTAKLVAIGQVAAMEAVSSFRAAWVVSNTAASVMGLRSRNREFVGCTFVSIDESLSLSLSSSLVSVIYIYHVIMRAYAFKRVSCGRINRNRPPRPLKKHCRMQLAVALRARTCSCLT